MTTGSKAFDYVVNQKALADGTRLPAHRITISMTQEAFEDYQTQKEMVHQGIRSIGLNPAEVDWNESPPIDEKFELAFKLHIGAAPDAQLIHYYPHSFHHRHYKDALLDGVKYVYMGFANGNFIKFAQATSLT